MDTSKSSNLFISVKEIIVNAKQHAFRSNNSILLNMYWDIGKLIVNEEQQGKAKAQYGKAVLKKLSGQLMLEFGKGFDERNLNNMRAFYLAFPIWNAVRTKLSWTHYRIISRIEDNELRLQYMQHAMEGNWLCIRSSTAAHCDRYFGFLYRPGILQLLPKVLCVDRLKNR